MSKKFGGINSPDPDQDPTRPKSYSWLQTEKVGSRFDYGRDPSPSDSDEKNEEVLRTLVHFLREETP
jgi:hypothetical protein